MLPGTKSLKGTKHHSVWRIISVCQASNPNMRAPILAIKVFWLQMSLACSNSNTKQKYQQEKQLHSIFPFFFNFRWHFSAVDMLIIALWPFWQVNQGLSQVSIRISNYNNSHWYFEWHTFHIHTLMTWKCKCHFISPSSSHVPAIVGWKCFSTNANGISCTQIRKYFASNFIFDRWNDNRKPKHVIQNNG